MPDEILQAAQNVFLAPKVWLVVFAAALYGVFVGAVPGLTATMAVALFVPLAYYLDSVSAIAAIVGMSACAIFAGDIPAVLLRMPGTPASAAYTDEAYWFTRRGQSGRVLSVALFLSVAGGLLGSVILMLLARPLALLATQLSSTEYFWLYLLGLSSAVLVAHNAPLRALFALLIGLLLATVGLSGVHTEARFTFGRPELLPGISFIPAMIGLFGMTEVISGIVKLDAEGEEINEQDATPPEVDPAAPPEPATWLATLESWCGVGVALLVTRPWAFLRSSAIGNVIGILPGAGADIAAWVSLATSKRFAPSGESEEHSRLHGVADAATANSASLAGAWIPALVFGIPGDSVTAIAIGVLMMKNIKPGPDIFEKQGVLIYSIYFVFLLANVALLPVGWLATRIGGYVVHAPRRVLLPVILLFCVVGTYAVNGSYFDVGVMLAMGFFGFVLDRRQIPLGPVVLGMVLGGPLEESFVQVLTASGGQPLALLERPLALALAATCLALWAWTAIGAWQAAAAKPDPPSDDEETAKEE